MDSNSKLWVANSSESREDVSGIIIIVNDDCERSWDATESYLRRIAREMDREAK